MVYRPGAIASFCILMVHCLISLWSAIIAGVDVPTLWQLPLDKEPGFIPTLRYATADGRLSPFWLLFFIASGISLSVVWSRGRWWGFVGFIISVLVAVLAERLGEYFGCLAFGDCHPIRVTNVILNILCLTLPTIPSVWVIRALRREETHGANHMFLDPCCRKSMSDAINIISSSDCRF